MYALRAATRQALQASPYGIIVGDLNEPHRGKMPNQLSMAQNGAGHWRHWETTEHSAGDHTVYSCTLERQKSIIDETWARWHLTPHHPTGGRFVVASEASHAAIDVALEQMEAPRPPQPSRPPPGEPPPPAQRARLEAPEEEPGGAASSRAAWQQPPPIQVATPYPAAPAVAPVPQLGPMPPAGAPVALQPTPPPTPPPAPAPALPTVPPPAAPLPAPKPKPPPPPTPVPALPTAPTGPPEAAEAHTYRPLHLLDFLSPLSPSASLPAPFLCPVAQQHSPARRPPEPSVLSLQHNPPRNSPAGSPAWSGVQSSIVRHSVQRGPAWSGTWSFTWSCVWLSVV